MTQHIDLDALQAAATEKLLKKIAFKLYKKHITGRGYVWPVGCSISDDVQAAVFEGMHKQAQTILALIDRLRKAETVPEGYKLVPIEPDDAMTLAGVAEDERLCDVTDIYRAMIDAAPDSAESEGERR